MNETPCWRPQSWFSVNQSSIDEPESWLFQTTEGELNSVSGLMFECPVYSHLDYSHELPRYCSTATMRSHLNDVSFSNELGEHVQDYVLHHPSLPKVDEGFCIDAHRNCPDPQTRNLIMSTSMQSSSQHVLGDHDINRVTATYSPHNNDQAAEDEMGACFAMKTLDQDHTEGRWGNGIRAIRRLSEYRHTHIMALLGSHQMARKMLSEAEQAATKGDKRSASLLEDVRVVVEFGQRKGWRDHASDIMVSLGQVCAACPVVLYDQTRLAHKGDGSAKQLASSMFGMSADVMGQYRGWIQRVLSTILPTTLADSVIDPSPPFFVIACVVLGSLVATQYNRSVRSQAQTHFLRNGAILGVLASLFFCYTQGAEFVATITAIIPMTTVAALLLNQFLDTAKDCLSRKQCRMEKLRRTLEILQVEGLAHRKGVRFVTL